MGSTAFVSPYQGRNNSCEDGIDIRRPDPHDRCARQVSHKPIVKIDRTPDYRFWAIKVRAVVNHSNKDIVYVLEAFDGSADTGVKTAWRRANDGYFFICFLLASEAEPAVVEFTHQEVRKGLGKGQAA